MQCHAARSCTGKVCSRCAGWERACGEQYSVMAFEKGFIINFLLQGTSSNPSLVELDAS